MGLSKFKIWRRIELFAVSLPLRHLAITTLPVLFAAFMGAALGGLAGMFVIASAPTSPTMPAVMAEPRMPVVQALIEVEPLDAPPTPVLALTVPGAPHRPALYALLLNREADKPPETVIAGAPHRLSAFAQLYWSYRLQEPPLETVIAGAPHRLSAFAQLFWSYRLQKPLSENVITGPAHKPAELAGLYAQSLNDNSSDGLVIPGAPHRPSDFVQVILTQEPQEKNIGAMAPWVEKPDQAEPGRLNERLAFLDQGEDTSDAPDLTQHTMPEIVLLLAAQGTTRDDSPVEEPTVNDSDNTTIALRSTWTIASLDIADLEPVAPAVPAIAPLPDEKPPVPVDPGVALVSVSREALVLDPALDGAPLIAIMIDDLGISEDRARLMSALPGPLTLAFMPYGENVAVLAEIAADAGHELFLHLPMEPMDATVDPGPHALLGGVGAEELMTQLLWNLQRFDGYVGVNNHMGSRLTQDLAAMNLVMAELGARGLIFIDSLTASASVAYSAARRYGLPAVRRDLFIDNVAERDAILAQLDALEAMALHRGYALGIAHPYDITAEILAEWLPSVQARGFKLVPASAIVAHNEGLLTRTAAE
jgi:polysaccharide deacetylase 2 family uncharacterized protein YibQ